MFGEKILGAIEGDEIGTMILRHYLKHCNNTSSTGQVPQNAETNGGHLGLGVSLNDIMLLRSTVAIKKNHHTLDCTHNYRELRRPDAWVSTKVLQEYLDGKETSLNKGISGNDGIVYVFDKRWLESSGVEIFDGEETKLFYNKIVEAAPRPELLGIFNMILGYYMPEALTEMEGGREGTKIGSGTTAQLSAQYFAALIAGPHCKMKEYRLRKTKITGSNALDVGHFLINTVKIKDEVAEQLTANGYKFEKALCIEQSIRDLSEEFMNAYHPLIENYACLSDIMEVTRMMFYSDRVQGKMRHYGVLLRNDAEEKEDITDYADAIV